MRHGFTARLHNMKAGVAVMEVKQFSESSPINTTLQALPFPVYSIGRPYDPHKGASEEAG